MNEEHAGIGRHVTAMHQPLRVLSGGACQFDPEVVRMATGQDRDPALVECDQRPPGLAFCRRRKPGAGGQHCGDQHCNSEARTFHGPNIQRRP